MSPGNVPFANSFVSPATFSVPSTSVRPIPIDVLAVGLPLNSAIPMENGFTTVSLLDGVVVQFLRWYHCQIIIHRPKYFHSI